MIQFNTSARTKVRTSRPGRPECIRIACAICRQPGPPAFSYFMVGDRPKTWQRSSWCTLTRRPPANVRSYLSTTRAVSPPKRHTLERAAGIPRDRAKTRQRCSFSQWPGKPEIGGFRMCVVGAFPLGTPQRSSSMSNAVFDWAPARLNWPTSPGSRHALSSSLRVRKRASTSASVNHSTSRGPDSTKR